MSTLAYLRRAVFAVAARSLRVHLRYRFGAAAQIFNAVMWLIPLSFLARAFSIDGRLPGLAEHTGTHDYLAFLVVGWIVSSYVYVAFWGVGFPLWAEMIQGTLEPNWLTPAPRWVFVVGRSLHTLLLTTASSLLLLLVAWGWLGVRFSADAVPAVLVLVPALVALSGLGFAVAGLVLLAKEPNNALDMLSYLTNVLAGDRFPPSALPAPLFMLALALPLTYAFDGLRHAVLGTAPLVAFPVEVAILAGFGVATMALGLGAFRLADRRMRILGTLGHH